MTDRPILMSAPMVRALLDSRKTQTRRLANRYVPLKWGQGYNPVPTIWQSVKPGDRLWVRETWSIPDAYLDGRIPELVIYKATPWAKPGAWRPSIHMPRWASRITLVVTATKRERVQEISHADCIAEGIWPTANSLTIDCDTRPPRNDYRDLWQSLHTKPGARWEDNPEVVALTFTVHQQNIDQMSEAA